MSKQVLSIEQMQNLKELGLDTSKASATVYTISETENYCGYSRDIVVADGYIANYINKYDTFTLQDILGLLPRQIIDEYASPLTIKCSSDLLVQALYKDIYVTEYHEDFIDAAYEMLCWCIEKGYVK